MRRAVSVENIGRVTCICSDKTGTITEGRLRVAHVAPGRRYAETRGCSRWPRSPRAARRGDPLDEAILDAAGSQARTVAEVLATFPFTEDRRRETAVVRDRRRCRSP